MKSHSEKSSSDWTIETEEESEEEASVVHIENIDDDKENKLKVIPIERDNEVYEVIDKYDTNVNDDGIHNSGSCGLSVNNVLCICAIFYLMYVMR